MLQLSAWQPSSQIECGYSNLRFLRAFQTLIAGHNRGVWCFNGSSLLISSSNHWIHHRCQNIYIKISHAILHLWLIAAGSYYNAPQQSIRFKDFSQLKRQILKKRKREISWFKLKDQSGKFLFHFYFSKHFIHISRIGFLAIFTCKSLGHVLDIATGGVTWWC